MIHTVEKKISITKCQQRVFSYLIFLFTQLTTVRGSGIKKLKGRRRYDDDDDDHETAWNGDMEKRGEKEK